MKYCLFLLITMVFAGCQKESTAPEDNTVPAQTFMNVPYGSDPSQVMDVYLPPGRSKTTTKLMIMIHGGAWASGDKSEFNIFVDTMKKRLPDYAVCNINYRLASMSGNFFPTQENDVKSAVTFILGKSDEYKISQKFVLLGASAGGHLALLQGYKNSTPIKAKAIVDFFGPTDMAELHDHPADPTLTPLIEVLLGGTPVSNPMQYEQSSPIKHVNAQSPPTIILQGGADPIVPFAQSTALDAKLQTLGVVHQYEFYPLEQHGWFGANLTHSFNAIQVFLTANVN
jgi:acetyl esterase/lipase